MLTGHFFRSQRVAHVGTCECVCDRFALETKRLCLHRKVPTLAPGEFGSQLVILFDVGLQVRNGGKHEVMRLQNCFRSGTRAIEPSSLTISHRIPHALRPAKRM